MRELINALTTFQFLEGAIKGPFSLMAKLNNINFNSSKVRLKEMNQTNNRGFVFNFNSSKVRLKGEFWPRLV